MAFAARMVRNIRATERHAVDLTGTLRDAAWQPFDVTVVDLSADGFRIPAVVDLPVGCSISLGLPGIGPRSAVVVRATGADYGCQFTERLDGGDLRAAIDAVANPIVPLGVQGTARQEDAMPPVPQYSPRMSITAILGLAIAGWGLLFAARLLLS